MSVLSDKQTANKAKIEEARNQAQTMLEQASLNTNLTAIIVPIGYAVSFAKAAGSALSDEDAEQLALDNNIEIFTAETV